METTTAPVAETSVWTKEDRKASRKANAKLHRKEYTWAAAFMAAPVIGWVVFLLFPMAFSIYASFTNWNGIGNMTFIGPSPRSKQDAIFARLPDGRHGAADGRRCRPGSTTRSANNRRRASRRHG